MAVAQIRSAGAVSELIFGLLSTILSIGCAEVKAVARRRGFGRASPVA